MCKGICIVRTNVRELNKVFMIFKEIENDRIGHLLQRWYIESSVFLNGLKCIVDGIDCIDARLLLNHVRWWWELVARIHGGHCN